MWSSLHFKGGGKQTHFVRLAQILTVEIWNVERSFCIHLQPLEINNLSTTLTLSLFQWQKKLHSHQKACVVIISYTHSKTNLLIPGWLDMQIILCIINCHTKKQLMVIPLVSCFSFYGHCRESLSAINLYGQLMTGSFPLFPSLAEYSPPPVEAVAAATNLFTEYVFCESVDNAHNSHISSTFQEADCLLKLVKVNKEVFAITLLNRNLNHAAQLSIS